MHHVPRLRMPAGILAVNALAVVAFTSACTAGPAPSGSMASPTADGSEAATATVAAATPAPTATPAPPATEPAPAPTVTPSVTESPGSPATPVTAPAAAAGLAWSVEHEVATEDGNVVNRYTVTWTRPLDPGTMVQVFGITACPNEPTPDGIACVTRGTPLPARIRTRLASAAAEAGSASWDWPNLDADGPFIAWDGKDAYFALVVRAVNAAGASRFVVVHSVFACDPQDCMS